MFLLPCTVEEATLRPRPGGIQRLGRAGLAFLILVVLAAAALASGSGVLRGSASDEMGQALPGVTVTVTSLDNSSERSFERSATTDAGGSYRFLLPPGRYEVRFELDGFSTYVYQVTIEVGRTETLHGTLSTQFTEAIVVTAEHPRVRPRNFRVRANAPTARQPPTGWYRMDFDTESYDPIDENRFRDPHDYPLSTFATDVDTASFANVRRFLSEGQRPPRDAVRLEELLNYFNQAYGYPEPEGEEPFSATVDVASAPWQPEHRLVRIGLRGQSLAPSERPQANLVFLLDVSGSMSQENKLPWVIRSLRLLVEQLEEGDRVAIVVYAGAAGVVLPPTDASDRGAILDALTRLAAGGSTNGGEGIELAYRLAREQLVSGGINRVILATDGDWNVGITDRSALKQRVADEAKAGVSLTVLGFGMGNYKDDLLEDLSQSGDGNYAYIDSLAEARKILVEQVDGTLVTIAKQVKIQAEFNPARVASYRLLGYENRLMPDEDFDDDDRDGGEIGAGHTVTALYEVVPSGLAPPSEAATRRSLRYQRPAKPRRASYRDELMVVRLRYQPPLGGPSRLIERIVPAANEESLTMSPGFRLAAGLATTAMILRDSPERGIASWDLVESLWADLDQDSHSASIRPALDLLELARRVVPDPESEPTR